jgi:hypothetical protein
VLLEQNIIVCIVMHEVPHFNPLANEQRLAATICASRLTTTFL